MTRRLPLFLFAALVAVSLLATAPLAAQPTEPQEPTDDTQPAEPVTESPAETAVGERVERAEEGTIQGAIVLLDADNLIVETAEGDRAFSLREASDLPAELRDADAWASYRGVPVRVSFAPGDEGELRVVRSVSLLGDDTPLDDGTPTTVETTTGTVAPGTVDQPFVTRTDDLDEGTMTTTTTSDGRTTGQLIADANDDQSMDDRDTAAGFVADDQVPPGERMASLPATASSLPWLALIGTLALLAALVLGRMQSQRRRVAVDGKRR